MNQTNFLLTNKTFLIQEGSQKAEEMQTTITDYIPVFFADIIPDLEAHLAIEKQNFAGNASDCVAVGFQNAVAECQADVDGIKIKILYLPSCCRDLKFHMISKPL